MGFFKLGLGITASKNSARFELSGSDEWMEECMPHIGHFMGEIIRAHGQDAANAVAIAREFDAARAAAGKGEDFNGEFLTVTRSKAED